MDCRGVGRGLTAASPSATWDYAPTDAGRAHVRSGQPAPLGVCPPQAGGRVQLSGVPRRGTWPAAASPERRVGRRALRTRAEPTSVADRRRVQESAALQAGMSNRSRACGVLFRATVGSLRPRERAPSEVCRAAGGDPAVGIRESGFSLGGQKEAHRVGVAVVQLTRSTLAEAIAGREGLQPSALRARCTRKPIRSFRLRQATSGRMSRKLHLSRFRWQIGPSITCSHTRMHRDRHSLVQLPD